jgi:adenine/guanine phosphoribosyltransferase-like PRPP-binding protein
VIASQYLDRAFQPETRAEAAELFTAMAGEVEFDTVVVTGTSGLLMGPLLAHLHQKKLLVVRKPKESTHSAFELEGWQDARRLVFVDDFVESGWTIRRVHEQLGKLKTRWEWAGAFLWSPCGRNSFVAPWPESMPVYQVGIGRWAYQNPERASQPN